MYFKINKFIHEDENVKIGTAKPSIHVDDTLPFY